MSAKKIVLLVFVLLLTAGCLQKNDGDAAGGIDGVVDDRRDDDGNGSKLGVSPILEARLYGRSGKQWDPGGAADCPAYI